MAPILKRELLKEMETDKNIKVGWDYSKVGVLQPDQNELRKSMDGAVERGYYAPNEARRRCGLPPIDKSLFDKIESGQLSVYDIPQVISRLGPVPWREPNEFPVPGQEKLINGPLEGQEKQAAGATNGNGNSKK